MLVHREVASMVTSRMLKGRGVGKDWRKIVSAVHRDFKYKVKNC